MKIKYKTADEAPEEIREFLKEETEGDAKFLAVSVVAKSRLDEMRVNNTKLSTEKEALAAQVATLVKFVPEGKTAEDLGKELEELRALGTQVKDGKIKGTDAIEGEVTKRTEAMRTAHDTTVQQLTKDVKKWQDAALASDSKFKQTVVDNAVMAAASDPKVGINPKAMGHVLATARQTFQVQDNGQLLAKDSGGNTVWGEDGATPMSISEWFKKLRVTDEFFFNPSTGGGASGGTGNGGSGGLSAAELAKMSPMDRLKFANKTAK
jgi:hypothetical protein